jgi:hypothetical protein
MVAFYVPRRSDRFASWASICRGTGGGAATDQTIMPRWAPMVRKHGGEHGGATRHRMMAKAALNERTRWIDSKDP